MKSEMNHPAADRLEAFVEGGLEVADRAVLESHLLGCPECQAAVEEWRALFAILAGLPQFEPTVGFSDRVMARVRIAPRTVRRWHLRPAQAALRTQAARAGATLERLLPKTTFGWATATAFIALPFVVGAVLLAWLLSRTYITPGALWAFASTQVVEGARSLGSAAVSAALQTEVAGWLVTQAALLLSRAGTTGIGMLVAAAGVMTALSIWVLYRNLFRTPTRESHYASYSF
jgi:hypothetical protein